MDKEDGRERRPLRGDRARLVHDALYREILTLKIRPGAPLDETHLAKRFQMSRSPVREALNRLSAQGLVVMLPNRSTLVAPLDLTAFPRYVEALDLLQRINTKLAAQNRSDADLNEMKRSAKLFDRSVARGDYLEMSASNKDFHMTVARAGGNPYLTRHYGALLDEGRRLLHLNFEFLDSSDHEYSPGGDHYELIAAIERRDAAEAEKCAHAHTRVFQDRFLLYMKSRYLNDFSLDPPALAKREVRARAARKSG
ncbi:MAG: GntR family transcriptional regulator [Kiloniellaceae bacterium]